MPGIQHMFLPGSGGGNDSFTKILFHFNAANGTTTHTNSALDPLGGTWTSAGGAQTSDTPVGPKFGSNALVIGNAPGRWLAPGTGVSAIGTQDFTLDFWHYMFSSTAGVENILFDYRSTSPTLAPCLYHPDLGTMRWFVNGSDVITGTTNMTTGVWRHVAIARQGTSTKLFINGTQEGSTYSDSNNYTVGTVTPRPLIGALGTDGTHQFGGWFDEMRLSYGIARWTSNFTPPTGEYF